MHRMNGPSGGAWSESELRAEQMRQDMQRMSEQFMPMSSGDAMDALLAEYYEGDYSYTRYVAEVMYGAAQLLSFRNAMRARTLPKNPDQVLDSTTMPGEQFGLGRIIKVLGGAGLKAVKNAHRRVQKFLETDDSKDLTELLFIIQRDNRYSFESDYEAPEKSLSDQFEDWFENRDRPGHYEMMLYDREKPAREREHDRDARFQPDIERDAPASDGGGDRDDGDERSERGGSRGGDRGEGRGERGDGERDVGRAPAEREPPEPVRD